MKQDPRTDDHETEAARRLAGALDPSMIDALLADAKITGTPIDGVDGLLNRMTKAVIERALQAEMTHELGYERDDPAGAGSGNSRNGSARKTISTANGPVTIDVPRDRNGTFEPKIVPKRARRLGQIDEMILSLYARGLSTRDIEAHLLEVYGVNASRELISNITDVVVDEIEIWRNRPVDEVYPIVYIDGLRIKVRDKGAVTIKVAHLAVGVDVDGRKHALGLWIAEAEGAKFWHSVLTQLRNRGLRDILILCCDGLSGLPDAVTSAFPQTIVQTCVVHVMRNAMRFVSYQDRKKIAAGMRTFSRADGPIWRRCEGCSDPDRRVLAKGRLLLGRPNADVIAPGSTIAAGYAGVAPCRFTAPVSRVRLPEPAVHGVDIAAGGSR